MANVRFLHAADIHLDSPLRGLEADLSAPAEIIRSATRRALGRLVDLAITEKVDFLLIAGDVFDGDWPDYGSGLFFSNQMRRLHQAGIPVFTIRGNHDAASRITRSLNMPHVFTFPHGKAETRQLDHIGVAIHGQSFASQAEPNDLSRSYPAPIPGMFNIGLLHTSAEGYAAHATYAPCELPRLKTHGYDYWALGHVHERQELAQDPWIVFPGNLQGRHVNETGPKGASLVTVIDRHVNVEHRVLDVLRWAHVPVALDGIQDEVAALAHIQSIVQTERDAAARPLAIRLTLTGTSNALTTDGLREKISNELANLGGEHLLWLESVKLRTTPPQAPDPSRHDNLTRLLAEIDTLATTPSPDLLGTWPETLLGKLQDALPAGHPLRNPETIIAQARDRLRAAFG